MTRQVGLPFAEALIAFAADDYATAYAKLQPLRGIAMRFGGSNAQRDILTLTMLHAALRGGLHQSARALAAERLVHKPHSPWARGLHSRAFAPAEGIAA